MSQLSTESRALLDAARDADEPTFEDRTRVRAALARQIAIGAAAGAAVATVTHAAAGGVGAAGAGSAAAGGVVAGGGTVVAGGTVAGTGVVATGGVVAGGTVAGTSIAAGAITTGIGAKLLVSVALVGAVGAGTVTYSRHEATKRAQEQRTQATYVVSQGSASARAYAHAAIPSTPAPTETPAPADETATETPTPTPTLTGTPTGTPTSLAAPAPSDSAHALDAELSLLQEAHSALKANDGGRALRALDEHAHRFPNGALVEEREAARVFALCALGRTDEAKDVAHRFLREHPRSPLTPRVARVCDDGSTF